MKSAIVVKNIILEEFKMWIDAERDDGTKLAKNLTIKINPYGYDYRCGWNTHLVTANIERTDKFHAYGFLSRNFDDEKIN